MILSRHREELLHLTSAELFSAILERRFDIRYHRDQLGDDRCFLDDYLVWRWLNDSPREPESFSFEEGMRQCKLFYEYRRAETRDPIPEDAILYRRHWDYDLLNMKRGELLDELVKIQEALLQHRDIGDRPRTADDDRLLYSVLPEKITADFRLRPREEFLGEARAPHAGCPAFWRSHSECRGAHDLHRWGPCTKAA